MIIALTGLAGSGKDTVAALLAMKGFQRFAFADELRKEVEESLRLARKYGGFNPKSAFAQVCEPELVKALSAGELTPEMVWQKPTPPLMRLLLQRHGTEFRRAQDPNYWVSRLMNRITREAIMGEFHAALSDHSEDTRRFVFISDLRFQNEADAVKARGGQIWRIVRPGAAVLEHVSEVEQQAIAADVEIANDGTVYDLALKVRSLL